MTSTVMHGGGFGALMEPLFVLMCNIDSGFVAFRVILSTERRCSCAEFESSRYRLFSQQSRVKLRHIMLNYCLAREREAAGKEGFFFFI